MESVSLPVAQGWNIPGCQAAVPSWQERGCSSCGEQGADVLFASSAQLWGFPLLGFGEQSLTPLQLPSKC